MIKLLDIVKEVELQGNKVLDNKIAIHDDLHYNDHMKEIEKHIQKSLATNDPKFIHKQLEEIIKHATSAQDKVLATNGRSSIPSSDDLMSSFNTKNANF